MYWLLQYRWNMVEIVWIKNFHQPSNFIDYHLQALFGSEGAHFDNVIDLLRGYMPLAIPFQPYEGENWYISSWVPSCLCRALKCLAQGHTLVDQVRLERGATLMHWGMQDPLIMLLQKGKKSAAGDFFYAMILSECFQVWNQKASRGGTVSGI